ncbi:Acetyltransferase (GNAT) family protein [Thalassovita litoralis]|jgi:N-acetylglutamate synthase-like GNAT family acetyltransferase|uniref:Acetyltransferase (GNAT) family protein n=1 Tax=Thalassovita litoralis TaxID=1010611 RepID=A0A521E3B6_9RHOB|nr:GNAT family N-acetyltransferase [Thalassovita litoralis]SMO78447.1 Acetyltransferase (GNAT) family protein [Thalassovita litoralis]
MIRQATAEDETAIRQCAEAAYVRYVPLIGQKPAPMIADFARQIAQGRVFVSVRDGSLQGFIVFYPEDAHMMLENVAVFPEAAGGGIGKALIRYCEDTARRMGIAAVRLYTNEKMVENLSIYPGMGYVETGRRVEDGFARVFFEKQLS